MPLASMGGPLLCGDVASNQCVGFVGEEDAVWIRMLFEAGREIDLATDDRVVHPVGTPEVTHIAVARVDADPHP